jgi:hypothetical protein
VGVGVGVGVTVHSPSSCSSELQVAAAARGAAADAPDAPTLVASIEPLMIAAMPMAAAARLRLMIVSIGN